MKQLLKKDKRGQVESILYIVITLVIVGLILFFFNHLDEQLYSSLSNNFAENPTLNNSIAHTTLDEIRDIERTSIWDWVFLAVFIGLNIQMVVLSFASRQNLAFFWIFVIVGLVILMLATVLSNIWQEVAANPEFVSTIARFPVTNTLVGSYFPTVITGIFYLFLIIIFGKFPNREN